MLRLKAIKMEAILRLEEGMKKRDALNVVPVIMRDENMGVNPAVAMELRQAVAQHAQTGAAIEDEMGAVRSGDLDAWRVAAVAPCVALRRGRRTAHTPENQFREILGHFLTIAGTS